VARDIFSIIPHGAGVEATFSLRSNILGWRQSKPTGKTIHRTVVVRQFVPTNNGILARCDEY